MSFWRVYVQLHTLFLSSHARFAVQSSRFRRLSTDTTLRFPLILAADRRMRETALVSRSAWVDITLRDAASLA
jgi:hypothetical protein